ncbi:MAG: choice-of-anchor D domain-containing protein [Bacteroidota bacterium]|nr:choice-of-anchor D domain-containing protein [Bacteroidota bacterium]MDP4232245.1 choice-of-anchor D domain-containing protein [Bacteroidota bacterium]MDP4243576.1 choice-of-anchor D domain-containing protein [Bacteroidota bacterium]MDP4289111.1 choice-of-anchor D domain-containing protein [Bacteroidota bacterium]
MKTWIRFGTASLASLVLMLLAMGAFTSGASAQGRVNKYTVTTPNLSWNDLQNTGGNWLYTDVWRYYYGALTTSLPFKFTYDNTTFSAGTTIYIQDASIGIGSNSNYGDNNGGLANSSYPARLFPWGANYVAMGDNSTNAGQSPSYGILEQTTGTSPNQVYTIQMTGVHTCWGSMYTSPSCISSMQVKFYQATGVIQFLYEAHSNDMSGSYSAGIGINGTTSPSFQYLSYTTGTWSTPGTDLQFTPPLPPAQLSLQPKSLNYGNVGTGFTLTQYDTVYSVGSNPLTIKTASLSGSTDFSIVSGPANGTVVPAGSFAAYGLQFAPTNNGARSATFTVVSDGNDSATQSCFLNGTGLAPIVEYTFPSTVYPYNTLFHHVARGLGDTAIQYIGVQNKGQVPLYFNSMYFIGLQAGMYTLIHVPPNPMQAGAADSIGVRFIPYLEGRPDAQLVINTDAINIPSDTVQMWGVGILAHLVITPQEGLTTMNGAGTLMFDSVAIGDSICKSLTLHNTGSDTLKILKQIVTYGDYDFKFYPLSGSDLTLPPDASKIVNVCFVPIKQGSRFASIRFYTNIVKTYPDNRDTSQFLISVTGTGVPYGVLSVAGTVLDSVLIDSTLCTTVTVKNSGLTDLTLSSATVTGSNNFVESTTPPLPITLSAGQSQLVNVCYTPKARGPEAATLVLNGTTSGRPLTQSLPLEGVGLAACLDAAPSPLAFGSAAFSGMTLANTENDTCITVTNCGDVPETFSAALSPGTSNAYSLIAPFIIGPIAPGGTGTLCVAFKPDTIGIMPGSVIVSASEKSATAKTLPLAGTGAGVVIAGSGQGTLTSLTKCDTFAVTIQNTGNTPWTPGTGAVMSGANGSDFTAIGTTTPATIPAGGSGVLMVQFCPTTSGTETAEMSFPTSNPAPLSGTVTLNAEGTSAGVTERTEQNGFSLGASYPNPTNGKADVIVTMPGQAKVTIALLNLQGSVVRTIYNGTLSLGDHAITLDATDLASGTYFYVLTSGDIRLTREMILSK